MLGIIDSFAGRVPELAHLKNRRSSDLLFKLGWYHMRSGDSRRAREACAQSFALRPRNLKSAVGLLFAILGPAGRAGVRWWYSLKR
ncbi:MAG: hypothetical protein HY770_02290 [Chitinivibrionia bacterium]|nr:hypothetical protein [Chitinivibrionia bacterium]